MDIHIYFSSCAPQGLDKSDIPVEPYPIVIKRHGGGTALVAHTVGFGEHVGNVSVTYNPDGSINSWHGKPVYLDKTVSEGEQIWNQSTRVLEVSFSSWKSFFFLFCCWVYLWLLFLLFILSLPGVYGQKFNGHCRLKAVELRKLLCLL